MSTTHPASKRIVNMWLLNGQLLLCDEDGMLSAFTVEETAAIRNTLDMGENEH